MHISILLLIGFWGLSAPSLVFSADPENPTQPKKSTPLKESSADRSAREAEEKRQKEEGEKQKKEAEENRQKEAEEVKRLTELYLRSQSVFIRKGELMVELNTFYNRNSSVTLQPVGGGVLAVKNTTRFIDNIITTRYGILTDGLELDLNVPAFIHAEQESDFGVARVGQKKDGVGDISAALRYQVWYEQGNRPGLIVDVNGKSRTGGTGLTGTGNWNAGGGITLIKSIDPVVFFGRVGYTYNFASQSRDLGNILAYSLGMGFSLNDKVSFNIQLTGSHIEPSKFASFAPAGAAGSTGAFVLSSRTVEIMNLLFTTTVIVTKRFSIEPFVGVGLTDQSFTMLGLRLPFRVLAQ